ncbi:MAG: SUMF1/EgtB/PvdO family nonheme iron enzyme [Saprospiraceae bacterium]|nr:SUMF1/EgtB/PvdO family nonheme iron enzyme [Saprospiraceae bacterium]
MNELYEKLIVAFTEKANIERDAASMLAVLKDAYPESTLPVAKTIKRFLDGETSKPQRPLLGFLAAYILGKTKEEVDAVYQSENFGDFYATFLEKQGISDSLSPVPDTAHKQSLETIEKLQKQIRHLKIFIGIFLLLLATLILIFWFINRKPILTIVLPKMISIKGGTYKMGDSFGDSDASGYSDELPLHSVTVDNFEMSETEITFNLFDQYCLDNQIPLKEDLGWGRNDRPVIMLDWYEATDFCNWLSRRAKLESVYSTERDKNGLVIKTTCNMNANGFRLPTEAEWEYAASVEITSNTKYRFGNHSNTINPDTIVFNCSEQEKTKYSTTCETLFTSTKPVKHSGLNKNGLYDMSGNVNEWCQDYYDENFYKKSNNTINPVANDSGIFRIVKGGSWNGDPESIRTAFRERQAPTCRDEDVGFRIVRRISVQ